MKKFSIIAILVTLAFALIALFGSRYGFQAGGLRLSCNQDKHTLEQRTRQFWEDIQFKDFKKAATYHETLVQKKQNIPYLLERLFRVKPEHLDVRSIEVLDVHIDSTGKRGRSRTKLTVKILNAKKLKHPETILYWYKRKGKWYMRLESSLRRLHNKR
jgi:hypothetical protein